MTQQTLWLIDATALPQVQSEQLYLSHLYIHDMDIGDRIAVKHMQLDASMQIESYGIIQAKRADSICVTWDRHFKAKTWHAYVHYGQIWKVTGQHWMAQALINCIVHD